MTGEQETAENQPVHFFIHIPKCGGNTFSDFLAKQFPLDRIYTAEKSTATWEAHRRQTAEIDEPLSHEDKGAMLRDRFVDEMRSHDLVIENHYDWEIARRLNKHRPLTTYAVLRDPRERVASHYLHLQRIAVEDAHELAPEGKELYSYAKQVTLAEFCHTLDRPDIWSTVYNRLTRTMSSHIVCRERYETYDQDAFLEDALQNLERTDFVADLRDLDEFAHLVSLANGWLPPGALGVLNPGEHASSLPQKLASEVPDDVIAHDLIVHEAAKRKYASWKRAVLDAAAREIWQCRHRSSVTRPAGDVWEFGFEGPLHGTNFHGREGTPPDVFRWMGPDTTSRVFIPVRQGVAQHVSVLMAAFIDPAVFAEASYRLNGSVVAPICSIEGNLTVATFAVPPEETDVGCIELCITVPHTASERDKGFGSDTRQKSIALRKIRVAPAHCCEAHP